MSDLVTIDTQVGQTNEVYLTSLVKQRDPLTFGNHYFDLLIQALVL